MDKLVIIPALVSIRLLSKRSALETFIVFFIPIVILVPTYYRAELVPGTPELGFWTMALIPIALVWVVRDRAQGYVFTLLDLVIVVHLTLICIGQFQNSAYKPAQKVLFNDVMERLLPYLLTKACFMNGETRIRAAKAIVLTGAVVAVFNLFEFRAWYNLLDKPWRAFWPHWVPWDNSMKRWGFKRAAGPFGHPICAGYFFAMVTPLAYWLKQQGVFGKGLLAWTPVALNAAGTMTSLSRAPILGMLAAALILWYAMTKRKLAFALLALTVLTGVGITLWPSVQRYVSVDRASAETVEQRNAAYRREIFQNYLDIVNERPVWGWGRFTVPWLKKQKSIDNEFLFMALTSGKPAVYLYIAMILFLIGRLSLFAMRHRANTSTATAGWALTGALLAGALTQTTVFAGTQTVQIFYMFIGMGEALLRAPATEALSQTQIIARSNTDANQFSDTLSRPIRRTQGSDRVRQRIVAAGSSSTRYISAA